jgi:hypothetical protein
MIEYGEDTTFMAFSRILSGSATTTTGDEGSYVAHAPEIWHKANLSDAKPLGSPSVNFSAGKRVSMCFGEMELLERVSCV